MSISNITNPNQHLHKIYVDYVDTNSLQVSGNMLVAGNTYLDNVTMAGLTVAGDIDLANLGQIKNCIPGTDPNDCATVSQLAAGSQTPVVQTIDYNGYQATNIGPVLNDDNIATKLYVDQAVAGASGFPLQNSVDCNGFLLQNAGAPVSNGDLTNKFYVDTAVSNVTGFPLTQNESCANFLLQNMADAVLPTDSANLQTVQNEIGNASIQTSQIVVNSGLDFTGQSLQASDPTLSTQVATKNYVDTEIANIPSEFPLTANVSAGGFLINSLGDALNNTDAMNKQSTAALIGISNINTSQLVVNSGLNFNAQSLQASDPTLSTEVATKNYVDTEIANIPPVFPLSADVSAGGFKITNLADAVNATDAMNLQSVQSEIQAANINVSKLVVDANLDFQATGFSTLADDPTSAQQVATKNYVDTEIANIPPVFPLGADVSANNFKITNLADAVGNQDAMNLQSTISTFNTQIAAATIDTTQINVNSGLDFTGYSYTCSDPVNNTELSNKQYTDLGDSNTLTSAQSYVNAKFPVINADLNVMAPNTLKGNDTGLSQAPQDLSVTNVKTMLSLNNVPNVDATDANNVLINGFNVVNSAIINGDNVNVALEKAQGQINTIIQALVGTIKLLGVWDASTNTPLLQAGTGTQGDSYYVSVAGNQTLPSGVPTSYLPGDFVFYTSTNIWAKLDATTQVITSQIIVDSNIDFQGTGFTILADDPTLAQQVATKNYVDTQGFVFNPMQSNLDAANFNITNADQISSVATQALTLIGDNNVEITATTGQINMNSEVDMVSNKIVNLLDPTNPQDGCTKAYADLITADLIQTQQDVKMNGFVNASDTTLSFNEGTRTVSVLFNNTSAMYIQGVRYEIPSTTQYDLIIANSQGNHFVYFDVNNLDPNGVSLYEVVSFTDLLILRYTYTCYVYWHVGLQKAILGCQFEQHGVVMDPQSHLYLHSSRGTAYGSGLGLSNIIINGDGSNNNQIEFDCSGGVIWDEDNKITINPYTAGTNIAKLYRNGANGYWEDDITNPYAVLFAPAGRAYYNQNVSGTIWQLTEIDNNKYTVVYLFAGISIDSTKQLFILLGDSQYNTIDLAQAAAIQYPGQLTNLPFAEFKLIASFVVHTQDSFTNSCKSIFVSADATGSDFIDFLSANIGATGNYGLPDVSNKVDKINISAGTTTLDSSKIPVVSYNTQGQIIGTAVQSIQLAANQVTSSTNTILGNTGGGTIALTSTQTKTLLALNNVANVDTTNASNITTGTLPLAQVPILAATNIDPNANITNSQLNSMAAFTVKGNNVNASGKPQDMSVLQTKTLLALENVQNVDQTNATNLTSGTVNVARLAGITNTQLSGTAGITNANLATMTGHTIQSNLGNGAAVPSNNTVVAVYKDMLTQNYTTITSTQTLSVSATTNVILIGALSTPITLTIPSANSAGPGFRWRFISLNAADVTVTNTLTLARTNPDNFNGNLTSLVFSKGQFDFELVAIKNGDWATYNNINIKNLPITGLDFTNGSANSNLNMNANRVTNCADALSATDLVTQQQLSAAVGNINYPVISNSCTFTVTAATNITFQAFDKAGNAISVTNTVVMPYQDPSLAGSSEYYYRTYTSQNTLTKNSAGATNFLGSYLFSLRTSDPRPVYVYAIDDPAAPTVLKLAISRDGNKPSGVNLISDIASATTNSTALYGPTALAGQSLNCKIIGSCIVVFNNGASTFTASSVQMLAQPPPLVSPWYSIPGGLLAGTDVFGGVANPTLAANTIKYQFRRNGQNMEILIQGTLPQAGSAGGTGIYFYAIPYDYTYNTSIETVIVAYPTNSSPTVSNTVLGRGRGINTFELSNGGQNSENFGYPNCILVDNTFGGYSNHFFTLQHNAANNGTLVQGSGLFVYGAAPVVHYVALSVAINGWSSS